MSATSNWKNNERIWPKILAKYFIKAERISRAGNYCESIHDTKIHDFEEVKSDCKFSTKGFKTSRLLDVVREKYCPTKFDIPLLFCRAYKERGGKVTVDAEFMAMLMAFWLGKADKATLWSIFTKTETE
jgi:hypothetical protein